MQFPESWLREFCNPPLTTQELADTLTMAGLEVEELRPVAPPFTKIVVGEIKEAVQHPDADRLRVCQVDVGQGALLNIVCGAPNARVGIKVPCALVGAELPPGDDGKPFAAILRWFIDNPGPDGGSTRESRGEILVVSRVGTADYGGSCMVALVDAKANPDANALARQMADDTASDFACGMQEPEWVGKRGDLVSDRTFSWPEGYVVE